MATTKSKRSKKKKRRSGPGRVASAGHRLAGHLAPQAADVIGIGLVVLALLTGLALWFDAAGPLGGFLTFVVRGTFGLLGYAFPLLALWWGLVLVRGTAEDDRGRMLVGLWFMLMGGLGVGSL